MAKAHGGGPTGPARDLMDLLAELRARNSRPSYKTIAARIPSTRGSETSRGYISEVFSGKKIPSGDMAVSIVKALRGSAREQERARRYAEAATADGAADGMSAAATAGTSKLHLALDLRQQRAPYDGGITINQAEAIHNISIEIASQETWPTISIDPPVELLPPKLHGRSLITSEIVDQIQTDTDDDNSPSSEAKMFWVLHGMGGAGKSAIALSIADYCAAADMEVFWISAGDATLMTAGMREIALRGARTSASVLNAGSVLGAAWNYLESAERNWLIVFDSADDPSVFSPHAATRLGGAGWIRPSSRGTVLVTSRLGSEEIWGRHSRRRKVSPLAPKYGARVVIDQLNERVHTALRQDFRAGIAAAEALSERLGGLPLALRAAGRYLARISGADGNAAAEPVDMITGYAAQLDEEFSLIDRGVLLDRGAGQPAERDLVTATWRLSLRLLEQTGKSQAIALLWVIGCMAPTPIPVDIFSAEVLVELGADQADELARTTELDIPLLLAALEDLALIETGREAEENSRDGRPDAGERSISLHRSVRDSIQSDLVSALDASVAGRYSAVAVDLLERATKHLDPQSQENQVRWGLLAAHVLALLPAFHRLPDTQVEALLDMALGVVRYMENKGDCEEAGKVAKEVFEISQEVHGRSDLTTLNAQVAYAVSLRAMNDFAGAESVLREAVDIAAEEVDADEDISLTARHELSQVYAYLGRHDEAEQEQQDILRIRVETSGDSHPATLIARAALATTLVQQRRFEEAEAEFRVVAAALAVAVGREHEATLRARQNHGRTLLHLGRGDEAIAELEDLVEILERRLGVDHPTVWALRVDIALALREKGDLVEAETLLRQSVEISDRAHDPDGILTITACNSLSLTLYDQGRFDEAKTFSLRAVLTSARTRGRGHPETLVALHNLEQILTHESLTESEQEDLTRTGLFGADNQDEITIVKALMEQIIARDGEQHIDVLEARIALHDWYVNTGDDVQAQMSRDRIAGDERLLSLFARSNVRRLVMEDARTHGGDRADAAVSLYRRFLSVRPGRESIDLWQELEVRGEFAEVLALAGRNRESADEYAAVLEQTNQFYGINHPNTLIMYLNSGGSANERESDGYRTARIINERMRLSEAQLTNLVPERIPPPTVAAVRDMVALVMTGMIDDSDSQQGLAMLSGFLCFQEILEHGPTHDASLRARMNFASAVLDEGQPARAEPFVRDLLVACISNKGECSVETLSTQRLLVQILYELGRFLEAKTEAKALLPLLEPSSDDEQATRMVLGRVLLQEGALEAAADVVEHITSAGGRTGELVELRCDLADKLAEAGRINESINEYGKALSEVVKVEGPFAHNALVVVLKLEDQLGDESSSWSDRPWFDLYCRIGGLIQSLRRTRD